MAARPLVLAIDAGLTNAKASLFDSLGQLVAQASEGYPVVAGTDGVAEQHPDAWWSAIVRAVHRLRERADGAFDAIVAIGVTAHMHGLVAVDARMRPLFPCWTLFDRRAQSEAERITRDLSPGPAYRITGARLEAYTPAAKMAWLREHEPELFRRAALFLSPKDIIRVQLGGDPVTDPIDAAGTLLVDLQTAAWSPEIMVAVGVPREKLPDICASTATAGRLSDEAARTLGLTPGIPLIVGAGDDIETLGAGLIEPGHTLEHIGTTGTLTTCLDAAIFDAQARVEVYPHAFPHRFLLGGATNAAGRSLQWARRWLAVDHEADDLPLTYPPADGIEAPLYLPFINGERGLLWDTNATGAFFGLMERHTTVHMARAVYEGVAFSLKEILEANRSLGAPVTRIVSGTPDANRAWSQLRADVYGYPIRFPATDNLTGLGVAMLALIGQGVFSSYDDAVKTCCHLTHSVEPNEQRAAYYRERFADYQAAVQAAQPLFSHLN